MTHDAHFYTDELKLFLITYVIADIACSPGRTEAKGRTMVVFNT